MAESKSSWRKHVLLLLILANVVGWLLFCAQIRITRNLESRNDLLLLEGKMVAEETKGRQEVLLEKLVWWGMGVSEKVDESTMTLIVRCALETEFPFLVLAVVSAESDFNPQAVSPTGAVGLGQIVFSVHGKKLADAGIIKTKRDLFGIEANIRATEFVLRENLEKAKGNVEQALKWYVGPNPGSGHLYRIGMRSAQLSYIRVRGHSK